MWGDYTKGEMEMDDVSGGEDSNSRGVESDEGTDAG